jgi:ribonuclease P/MRP protein subunit POP1
LLSDINRLRLKRNPSLLIDDKEATNLLKGALINVRVNMCSRGTPEDLAMIYLLPDAIVLQWEKVLHSSKVTDDESPKEIEVQISSFHLLSLTRMMQLANTVPDRSAIIGYVTTGQFSLARGRGYALGAIRLTSMLDLEQQSVRCVSFSTLGTTSKVDIVGPRLHSNRFSKPSIMVGVRNTDGSLCRTAYLEALSD